MRDGFVGTCKEIREKIEFWSRKAGIVTTHRYLSRGEVNVDTLLNKRLEVRVPGRLRQSPQCCPYSRQQLRHAEWLCNIVIRSSIKGFDLIRLCAAHSEHDDCDLGSRSDQPASFHPAHSGHVHIQQH